MGTIDEIYQAFTKGKDMDSRTFVKVWKDAKLLGKDFTTTDCDILFTKSKDKGSRGLTFDQFEATLNEVAKKKKMTVEALTEKMCAVGGPQYYGTKAEAVRFHDDKNLYTGVHAHGGPSTLDKPNTKFTDVFSNYEPNTAGGGGAQITLADMCDRTPPNIRGVNKNFTKS